MDKPETIIQLSKEQLEDLLLASLFRENQQCTRTKILEYIIDEVRRYINREEFIDYIPNTKNYMRLMKIKCDLLQILDKAIEDDRV